MGAAVVHETQFCQPTKQVGARREGTSLLPACRYTEILTWALLSRAENFTALRRKDDGNSAVGIGNPATAEFEICRTSLLPGDLGSILHQLSSCLSLPPPTLRSAQPW